MKQDGGSKLSNILPALTKVTSKDMHTITKSLIPGYQALYRLWA